MKYLILFLSVLALLLAACSEPSVTCNAPYILKGAECCLDTDGDSICDNDCQAEEPQCPELDCSKCQAEVVTRNVTKTVTKFVCIGSGAIVDAPDLCKASAGSLFLSYNPVTSNENGTVIEDFTPRPACRDGFNALELHWKVGSAARLIEVQVKESPQDPWKTVFNYSDPTFEKYVYGVFCDGKCTINANFYLKPDKAYLLRGKFDYQALYDKYQFSNEHIIDQTTEGTYGTKLC